MSHGAYLFVPNDGSRPLYTIASKWSGKVLFFTLEGSRARAIAGREVRVLMADAEPFGSFIPLVAMVAPDHLCYLRRLRNIPIAAVVAVGCRPKTYVNGSNVQLHPPASAKFGSSVSGPGSRSKTPDPKSQTPDPRLR